MVHPADRSPGSWRRRMRMRSSAFPRRTAQRYCGREGSGCADPPSSAPPLRQFPGRPGLILDAEGDLAVRVHVKNCVLGFWNTDPTLAAIWYMGRLLISCPSTSTLPVKFSLVKLRDQSVHQPCDGGLAASAAPTEQDTLPIRDGQVNVPEAIMLLPLIGKGYLFQFDHPNTPFP